MGLCGFNPRPREGATVSVFARTGDRRVSIRAPVRGRQSSKGGGNMYLQFQSAPP